MIVLPTYIWFVKQNGENGIAKYSATATSTIVSTVDKSNISININVSVHTIASKVSFTSLYMQWL